MQSLDADSLFVVAAVAAIARLGVRGWLVSVVPGFAAALVLHLTGVVISSLLVGVALCTTALGTLMPILRDSGDLRTSFGNHVVAAGRGRRLRRGRGRRHRESTPACR